MKNIPMFVTENGAASLILDQIPYSRRAYIRLLDSAEPELLLKECCDFCKAVGAEKIYASGNPVLEKYPVYTSILLFSGDRALLQDSDFTAIPVSEGELDRWRQCYNDHMKNVAGAAYMTQQMVQRYFQNNVCYDVIDPDGDLCGIGIVEENTVRAVISLYRGMGGDILAALCKKLPTDRILLEVASTNERAVRLYLHQGMQCEGELSQFHEIF